ncbi:hypothetical protein GCM10025881_11260 [Pseudolysinimonas kribbensis]|uniref:Phospho-sugar mutase n=1 Tax=Pseudolysinimonas kribbensis TaxID=433641 RepID=A0ABQ6K127_9MICO|nr:hypothetical protein GCM10025881_11260 [Pseudolysinimonas kribbensis]
MTLDQAEDGGAVEEARAWIAQDPDAQTRDELQALLDAAASDPAAAAELEERFAGRLDFGTAGLRGELGAGPTRMNRVLVAQAAAGLAAYLRARQEHPTVVIGYDGRTNSGVFARDSAALLQGAGVHATLLPRELPTPVLAFAVRHLDASAGIMVTASHNPARDNGYKVYLGGLDHGSQIVPPADAAIQAEILRVAAGSIADLPRDEDYTIASEDLVAEYVRRTAAPAEHTAVPPYVYTAMHGVGWQTASAVFAAAGFPPPVSVRAQQDPDPAFPTVSFPNPEEPGALDLAVATARDAGAQLIIANDPDADRLAVGIPDSSADTGWRRLAGNEVGWLLGWQAARRVDALTPDGGDGTLAASLVSSPRSARSRGRPGWTTRRRSPGSSGSRASHGSCSATRRPSATSSTPTRCATRTVSPRPSRCSTSRHHCAQRAARSPTSCSRSPRSSAGTRRGRSRSGCRSSTTRSGA